MMIVRSARSAPDELDGGATVWLVDYWPKVLVWIDDVHDAGDHVSGWLTYDAARQAGDL